MPPSSRVNVNIPFQTAMSHQPLSIEARVERIPECGCWIWMGGIDRDGYARLGGTFKNRNKLVHRLMHERHNGPIPAGYHVDHLCRVRSCVNPAHLEAVTPRENAKRMRVGLSGIDQCIRGHLFDEQNTQHRADGKRNCKACKRAWAVAHKGS